MLSACALPNRESIQETAMSTAAVSLSNASEKQNNKVALPEPFIVDNTNQRLRFPITKLTEKNNILYLNNSIVFNQLNLIMAQQEIANIQLTIESYCSTQNKTKVYQATFHRPLTRVIPLITILPEEIFLDDSMEVPICSFSFVAKNPSGASHYFKMPHAPVMNIHHSSNQFIHVIKAPKDRNISQKTSVKMSKDFPYMFFEKMPHFFISKTAYVASTGNSPPINTLKLQCDHFSLQRTGFSENTMQLSSFFKKNDMNMLPDTQTTPIQKCRLFAYHNKMLVAISLKFHLVFPHQPPSMKVVFKIQNSRKLYDQIQYSSGSVLLFSYDFHNPYAVPVFLKIKNYFAPHSTQIKRRQTFQVTGLYYQQGNSFYRSQEANIIWGEKITTNGGASSGLPSGSSLLIKLEPNGSISFPMFLHQFTQLCSSQELSGLHWLGAVFHLPRLEIQQVLSYQFNQHILSAMHPSKTYLGQDKSFSVLAKPLSNFFNQNTNQRELLFNKGSCSKGSNSGTGPFMQISTNEKKEIIVTQRDFFYEKEKIPQRINRSNQTIPTLNNFNHTSTWRTNNTVNRATVIDRSPCHSNELHTQNSGIHCLPP